MKRFGVMLDCSRNALMKPEEIINFAKLLKAFGYNMIQLYTEDTFEVDEEPFFGYMRARYTQSQLSFIVEECEKIGIEVIPCVQTLAHLNQIFRWEQYRDINDTADILLVGEDRTYKLIENIFKTLRKCFKSSYVHIGMDEAHMLGLGKFLDKNGFKNRFEILSVHLKKVISIAEKYNFKPIMWSDMFFRLGNHGEYAPENPNITQEVVDIMPKSVGLVYWDYYHEDKNAYDKMFSAHRKFNNEIWFAGGAWTWTGFASGNEFTMQTMIPAMQSAKEHQIENILFALWGDNGKECSFYSVLPSLFALKKFYDGQCDISKVKTEFKEITGEDFDALCACDLPNYVGGNRSCKGNISKYALYGDPFNCWIESEIKDSINEEYVNHAKKLSDYAKKSKKYSYIFETLASLCDVLSKKYGLGYRTRIAYNKKDNFQIYIIIEEYLLVETKLEIFYQKFRELWYKENNPNGFDVHDIRLGGLKQRLKSCRERLMDYVEGNIVNIPEFEENILNPCSKEELFGCYMWSEMATTNVL